MRKARLTVVSTVYHQVQGGEPTSCVYRGARDLSADEQPYIRRFTSSDGPLDTGWLESCSMLVLLNVGDADVRIGDAVVRPRMSAQFEPTDLKSLRISGVSKCVLYLFPP